VRSIEHLGSFALLDPLLERAHFVKHVRPFAAAAVAHARFQEQPDTVGRVGGTAHLFNDAVVILDGIQRRNLRVTPAVIQQQLPAV
jgi:hypothetical protein